MTEQEEREHCAQILDELAEGIRTGRLKLNRSSHQAPLEWAKHPTEDLQRVRPGEHLFVTFEFTREPGEWSPWHEPFHPEIVKDEENADHQTNG